MHPAWVLTEFDLTWGAVRVQRGPPACFSAAPPPGLLPFFSPPSFPAVHAWTMLFSLALKTDGTHWAWGDNSLGLRQAGSQRGWGEADTELPFVNAKDVRAPTRVGTDSNWAVP